MLQAIRSKVSGLVAKVFFVFLALVFGVWGIGNYEFMRAREQPVITVGDITVSPQRYDFEYRRMIEQIRRQMGGQLDSDTLRQLNIASQVTQRLTDEAAIDQALATLGITVSDDAVRASILANPQFRGRTGQFDRNIMLAMLNETRQTEMQFFNSARRDLARDALAEALVAGTRVPEVLVDRLYRLRQERRVAQYVAVPNSTITELGEPTEEQLSEIYEDNQETFTRPEYRQLTLLRIGPDELMAGMRPSEEDLREEYQARQAEIRVPERRDIDQIRFSDEAAARAARERIVAGTDFAEVQREVMGEAAAQMRLANITRRELPTDLAAAFDLPENEVSEPLRSPFGWHLLRTVRIEAGREPTFDEMRATLETDVRRRLATQAVFDAGTRAEDAINDGKTVAEAAALIGVTPIAIPAIDVDGKDPEGAPVAALASAPEVLRAAFTTNAGQTTPLIDTREGIAFIARVDQVTQARLQPLEEVRARAIALWQAGRRRDLARERAQAILAKVNEGKTLAEAAAEFSLTAETTPPTLRTRGQPQPDGQPPELVGEMFRLQLNAAGVATGRDGSWVVRLTEIQPADPAADATAVTRLREELRQQLSSDVLREFLGATRARYGVTIDQPQIDRLTTASN
jgi:peptidyl-prolyl cis-trans isomerase D